MITETTITEDNESAGTESQGFHLLVMSLEVFWSQRLPASGIVTVGRSKKCDVQIDDATASREHARIHIGSDSGVPVLMIEDVDSANGTRVRDTVIKPGEPAAILPGEAITVGSTVLMIMQDRPTTGIRRIWSHAYFETRVEDECIRAAKTRAPFALARIRFTGAAPWTRVTPVLARELTAPHVVASYGPQDYETLFLDVQPGDGEALVKRLREAFSAAGLTAHTAVAWYPNDGRTCDALLAAANAALKRAAGKPSTGEHVGPQSSGMQRVRAMATRAASSNINVLILGESGVGKDVLARMIHQLSPRAGNPFLAINCASLPENLLESELFGHEKGSFTSAGAGKVGLFESANGGTVFLDEIGEMPPNMQAKLLQAIELREVRAIGALRPRPIDVRFLSATNVDIETAVAKGTFRRDLMYRLNTLTLAVPPLRERKEEISELATTFVLEIAEESSRDTRLISADAMACLLAYSWPGNIRELRNVIERAVVLCDGAEIRPEHLPLEKMRPAPGEIVEVQVQNPAALPLPVSRVAMALPPLTNPEEAAERQRILEALESNVWSQTRAASALNMSRRTLVSKLDRYGIPRPQKRAREHESEQPEKTKVTPPGNNGTELAP